MRVLFIYFQESAFAGWRTADGTPTDAEVVFVLVLAVSTQRKNTPLPGCFQLHMLAPAGPHHPLP